jgi:hypothetical protein
MVSNNFGFSFIQTTVLNNMYAISMSSTGQYQCAISTGSPSSEIYVSSNFGVTWTIPFVSGASAFSWLQTIVVSPTGQYMFAGGGGTTGRVNVYSTNFGVSWTIVGSILQRTSSYINFSTLITTSITTLNTLRNVNLTGSPGETTPTSPGLVGTRTILSDGGLRIVHLSSTQQRVFMYSIDGGTTFSTGTLAGIDYGIPEYFVSAAMSNTTLYVYRALGIHYTTDFVNWTLLPQNEIALFVSAGFRNLTVSYDNTMLYALYSNGTLYSQKIYNTSLVTPTSLLYLNGLTSNIQGQLNTLTATGVQFSGTNVWTGTNTYNSIYETAIGTTGTTSPFTANMALGSTFYIPTDYTFASNFQLILTNVPTDTTREYTISIIYRQPTTLFYISTARVSDTATTYLLGTASTFSAPSFNGGVPVIANSPNLIIQSFAILSIATSASAFSRFVTTSVSNHY